MAASVKGATQGEWLHLTLSLAVFKSTAGEKKNWKSWVERLLNDKQQTDSGTAQLVRTGQCLTSYDSNQNRD